VLLFLDWLRAHRGVQGPFLVVAPLSTLAHWGREATHWTGLRAVVLAGGKESRRAQLRHYLKHTDEDGVRTVAEGEAGSSGGI